MAKSLETLKAVGSIFSVLLCLVLVLVLAYQSIRMLGRRMGAGGSAAGNLKVLDRLSLGQEQSLYIVEAADKILLLGATPHSIQLLQELDSQAVTRTPSSASSGAGLQAGKMPAFGEILRGMTQRPSEEKGGPKDGGD